jgi:hypothetical protein
MTLEELPLALRNDFRFAMAGAAQANGMPFYVPGTSRPDPSAHLRAGVALAIDSRRRALIRGYSVGGRAEFILLAEIELLRSLVEAE